jgi:hypothetical protein
MRTYCMCLRNEHARAPLREVQAEEQAEELAQNLAKSNEAQRKANSNYSDWRKRITINREATVPEEEVRSDVCMHAFMLVK